MQCINKVATQNHQLCSDILELGQFEKSYHYHSVQSPPSQSSGPSWSRPPPPWTRSRPRWWSLVAGSCSIQCCREQCLQRLLGTSAVVVAAGVKWSIGGCVVTMSVEQCWWEGNQLCLHPRLRPCLLYDDTDDGRPRHCWSQSWHTSSCPAWCPSLEGLGVDTLEWCHPQHHEIILKQKSLLVLLPFSISLLQRTKTSRVWNKKDTMFDLSIVNGLAVRMHAFGLFNWIVIGQTRQLI